MVLRIKLKELMKGKNITQLALSEETGIRQAAISELINMKRQSVNIEHLNLIITAMKVSDVNKLFEIVEE